MRYDCDEPAFEGDYIEISDSFSRAQKREAWDAFGKDEELFLSLLRPKILGLHLTCVDADPITSAEDLTTERLDQMDVRMYTWFSCIWVAHSQGLTDLGNALGRRLFVISATIATTEAVPASRNHS